MAVSKYITPELLKAFKLKLDDLYATAEALEALKDEVEVEIEGEIPTKVSQLENDSEYQTLTEVTEAIEEAIAGVTQFKFEIVEQLPNRGEDGVIYLVLIDSGNTGYGNTKNIYNEYIWVNNAFELLGTTEIDLSNYWSKDELAEAEEEDIEDIFSD